MANLARDLVAEARAGSSEALGRLLESCRPYLLMVARQEIGPDLQAKGSASDLVQDTFLEAKRDFRQFHGNTEEELLAWLRRLLLNNLANFSRSFRGAAKREIGREVSLDGAAEVSETAAGASSLIRAGEQSELLRRAIDRLPDDYQTVIRLRYEKALSFDDIARQLQRTPNAVRKLWARAIDRLHEEMGRPP
jgi:RNA polymerase sigma-70 factor (ECF subfamily)